MIPLPDHSYHLKDGGKLAVYTLRVKKSRAEQREPLCTQPFDVKNTRWTLKVCFCANENDMITVRLESPDSTNDPVLVSCNLINYRNSRGTLVDSCEHPLSEMEKDFCFTLPVSTSNLEEFIYEGEIEFKVHIRVPPSEDSSWVSHVNGPFGYFNWDVRKQDLLLSEGIRRSFFVDNVKWQLMLKSESTYDTCSKFIHAHLKFQNSSKLRVKWGVVIKNKNAPTASRVKGKGIKWMEPEEKDSLKISLHGEVFDPARGFLDDDCLTFGILVFFKRKKKSSDSLFKTIQLRIRNNTAGDIPMKSLDPSQTAIFEKYECHARSNLTFLKDQIVHDCLDGAAPTSIWLCSSQSSGRESQDLRFVESLDILERFNLNLRQINGLSDGPITLFGEGMSTEENPASPHLQSSSEEERRPRWEANSLFKENDVQMPALYSLWRMLLSVKNRVHSVKEKVGSNHNHIERLKAGQCTTNLKVSAMLEEYTRQEDADMAFHQRDVQEVLTAREDFLEEPIFRLNLQTEYRIKLKLEREGCGQLLHQGVKEIKAKPPSGIETNLQFENLRLDSHEHEVVARFAPHKLNCRRFAKKSPKFGGLERRYVMCKIEIVLENGTRQSPSVTKRIYCKLHAKDHDLLLLRAVNHGKEVWKMCPQWFRSGVRAAIIAIQQLRF